jgi:hypothetical protein
MPLPTMTEFTSHVEQAMVDQIVWAQKFFHLPALAAKLQIWDKETGYLGHMKTNYKDRQFAGYTIRIQSFHFLRQEVQSIAEYSSYSSHPVIGSFLTTDWKLAVEALIAHELAHLVQYALKRDTGHQLHRGGGFYEGLGQSATGHGDFFQNIYKIFRGQWINDKVGSRIGLVGRSVTTFKPREDFKERVEAMPKAGIEGMVVHFKDKPYTIAGRNPKETSKLYRYQVQDAAGKFYKVSISQLVRGSAMVEQVILHDPALYAELQENVRATQTKKVANAKSSMTKKVRAAVRKSSLVRYS